jgi:hypothetical protein
MTPYQHNITLGFGLGGRGGARGQKPIRRLSRSAANRRRRYGEVFMRLSVSPFVVRVWLPILLFIGLCSLFQGVAFQYWLLALPMLLVIVFMTTLAEVHYEGSRIQVKILWKSMDLPREEIVSTAQSVLDGIGVLRLRRFVPPWGRIYFVSDWSKLGVAVASDQSTAEKPKPYRLIFSMLGSIAAAISGFFATLAMRPNSPNFRIETFAMRIVAVTLVGLLCLIFGIIRYRYPAFANGVLFVAGSIIGFIHW